nr:hypothetical protein [Mycobacterium sp. IS-1496]
MGLRYRVNARPLPSLRRTADVIFERLPVAVFVDRALLAGVSRAPPSQLIPGDFTVVGPHNDQVRLRRERLGTDDRPVTCTPAPSTRSKGVNPLLCSITW